MTAEELGDLYDEKRRLWDDAILVEGDRDDEWVMEVAARLGLEFDPPEYLHGTQGQTACGRCGTAVASEDLHTRWHRLVSAGIKLATWEANLGHLGAAFLGIALREFLARPDEIVEEEEQWTDSGHGWIYPLDSGAHARCGGPGVCGACNADELHSLKVHDEAADRYYARLRVAANAAAIQIPGAAASTAEKVSRTWILEHPEKAVRIACGDHDAVVRALEGEWGTLGTILEMIAPLTPDTRARVLESALVRVTASETLGPVEPDDERTTT